MCQLNGHVLLVYFHIVSLLYIAILKISIFIRRSAILGQNLPKCPHFNLLISTRTPFWKKMIFWGTDRHQFFKDDIVLYITDNSHCSYSTDFVLCSDFAIMFFVITLAICIFHFVFFCAAEFNPGPLACYINTPSTASHLNPLSCLLKMLLGLSCRVHGSKLLKLVHKCYFEHYCYL